MSSSIQPLIGIVPCVKSIDQQDFFAVGQKYVRALVEAADVQVVCLPDISHLSQMVARLDGFCLPGSRSNLHTEYYDVQERAIPPFDATRDEMVMALFAEIFRQKKPVLAICRGMQELNVACGGTLYPDVQGQTGRMGHQADYTQPLDLQYALRHEVQVNAGGILSRILPSSDLMVNSLHGQGIKTLGDNLYVEAQAPDGQIEAISYIDPDNFVLGVQWHPEWAFQDHPANKTIFQAFGSVCRGQSLDQFRLG